MKGPTEREAAMLTSIATSFARAFEEPSGDHPLVAARKRLLGPTTLSRSARSLGGGGGLGDRVADVGLRIAIRDARRAEAPHQRVNASATGCVVASALTAWRMRDVAEAVVELGPRSDIAKVRELLAPVLETGELVIREAEVEPARTRVIVAPYFYSPGDLGRVAEAIALERAVPSPHAEGDLEIHAARGWAQRHLFRERLAAAIRTFGGAAVTVNEIDADDTTELLEKARHLPPANAAVAFVYPMLRERPEVERALTEMLDAHELGVVNHTPAISWALGRGALPVALRIEADQRMRGIASARAMARRARFEAEPSVGHAVAALAWSWVG
ncbi:MAG: hypothetical protein JNK04_21985 [Myxococcales bacterium]|nr:hypothetical protein [Myxococcales bacterium]